MPQAEPQRQLSTEPDSLKGLIGMAAIRRQEGKIEDALVLIEQACSLHPDHLGVRMARQTLQRTIERRSVTLLGPPVTLTAISHRLHTLPLVVGSLLRQSLPPAQIHLHVSEEPYLLDAGIRPDDETIRGLASLPRLKLHWVQNLGPYRKVASFLLIRQQTPRS